jgi:hypothetical protein
MRTKSLLGLAALAVGLSSSMAQVYSLNVVGYVNVPLQANKLSFVSVPLTPNGGNFNITNTIVLNDAQDGANIYAWAGTGWDANQPQWYAGGTGWYPDMVIQAGKGFFLKAGAADGTITFVGEVPQGTLSYNIPTGLSTLANQVPDGSAFPGGTVGHDGDNIFSWDQAGQKWSATTWQYYNGLGWNAGGDDNTNGPAIAPGSAVFYSTTGAAIPFTRSFTVQ